ncbi:phage tail protein [Nostocaceae cyanobacterium CENA369]|uniref:Phage tail protein n=1 Tax=Dendronalium phyllosphericum CENA369 TaxID=1725256 RepID=A0A8J7I8S2_9NOST|nr:phage tail protein [Dendronalium phyllosphericum]MBH8575150.1 phage tail protein [Dendronalium phyllosphericum CENA369]
MADIPEILTNSRFYLELKLDGSQEPIDGYFMECQGFKRTQDVIEVAEVTPQQWGQAKAGLVVRTKIPGNVKTNNLVLRRGMTISMTMWKWFKAVEEGNWAKQRRDGSLVIYNQGAVETARFEFRRAWPSSYKITDLNASANEFEVEEMELAVEELIRLN